MRRAFLATVLTLLAACAAPVLPEARADLGASGTRLSIAGGAPRFFMTYGHVADAELYAPIAAELARVQVSFQTRGEDVLVYHRGLKVATWPVVREREDVPETGETPCVLVLGGNVYVPVRALARLVRLNVSWDKRGNLIAIIPTGDNRGGPVAVQPREVEDQLISLSAIEVEQKGARIVVRVRSSAPIRPRWTPVNTPPSPRIALDFENARWASDVLVPPGIGDVRVLRVGRPTPTTARLVLEITSPQVKVVAINVAGGEMTASIGRGAAARNTTVPSDPIREALRRRAGTIRMSSRGGSLDNSIDLPGEPSQQLPPVEPSYAQPERLPNLRFNPAGSLRGRVIVVDAGHGGHSSGARGLNNLEKDLCLKMSLELERALLEQGATVIMTRRDDVFVSLDARCNIANRSGAEIFISIHCNSMPRRNTASGTQTYWRNSRQSLRLARALHGRVVSAVAGRDGGIRNGNFQVIRETTIPSVLLEIAFINNTLDEQILANGEFHGRLAESLARGVLDYFGTDAGN
jgi:N-acetylmuramoyl-L-alanine amidase